MSIRKCLACRTILTGEDADCPVCGNPDYIVPNMTPNKLKTVQSWADDYREGKLQGMEVDIYTYSHEMKENKLVQKSVDITKVCDAKALSFEKIIWLDEKFARIDTDKDLKLTAVVKKDGKEFKKQEFSFKAPALQDFWHIGAQLTDGLGVCLVIGNENTNVKTKSIALI